ncbi:MAG: hypothetical protein Q4G50_00515 [Corynebacterium sp.]|uniref:hypothetical protein n=1 Tax=Corynebacterium sp. TaxID=1720 RepID=UPI0026DFA3F4|nr:hypothetical protein [Corynebacterium sp.]MDO5668465.1 hypothetical protein [Corynebacterium sp.]
MDNLNAFGDALSSNFEGLFDGIIDFFKGLFDSFELLSSDADKTDAENGAQADK